METIVYAYCPECEHQSKFIKYFDDDGEYNWYTCDKCGFEIREDDLKAEE